MIKALKKQKKQKKWVHAKAIALLESRRSHLWKQPPVTFDNLFLLSFLEWDRSISFSSKGNTFPQLKGHGWVLLAGEKTKNTSSLLTLLPFSTKLGPFRTQHHPVVWYGYVWTVSSHSKALQTISWDAKQLSSDPWLPVSFSLWDFESTWRTSQLRLRSVSNAKETPRFLVSICFYPKPVWSVACLSLFYIHLHVLHTIIQILAFFACLIFF